MTKIRYFSTKNDFKTGFLYKVFLIIGIVLLVFSLVANMENITGITLAFSILFIGGGILLGFFSYLFSRLAKISDEVEKDLDFEKIE